MSLSKVSYKDCLVLVHYISEKYFRTLSCCCTILSIFSTIFAPIANYPSAFVNDLLHFVAPNKDK